jgi:hypothetical protein
MTYAQQKGAIGIILVAPPQIEQNWQQANTVLSRTGFYPEKFREKALPTLMISQKVAQKRFCGN